MLLGNVNNCCQIRIRRASVINRNRAALAVILLSLLVAACATRSPLPQGVSLPATAGVQTVAASPEILVVSPGENARQVPTHSAILAGFSKTVDPATCTQASFKVSGMAGSVVCEGPVAVFRSYTPLARNTTYMATIATVIKDGAGNPLSADYTWSFTTEEGAALEEPAQIPTASGRMELFRYPYLQTDSPRRMKILWAIAGPGVGQVQYREAAGTVWKTATSNQKRFPASHTGLANDFIQHEVILDDLLPGTRYVYNVTHNGVLMAAHISFETWKEDPNEAVRFAVFGDSGTKYSQPRSVRDAIVSRDAHGDPIYPHDFVVGVGDIAYYTGSFQDFDARFFNQLSGKGDRGDGRNSILATHPFVPVLGNHEYGNNDAADPLGFLESFSRPNSDGIPARDVGRYYSFDAGNAHFVVLDSMKFEKEETRGAQKMLHWLEMDLARTVKRWRIVFFHHAVFAHGPHGTYGDIGQNRRMRQRMAPILQRHGVQLVIFGHDHLYERSKRMKVDRHGRIIRDKDCHILESDDGIVYVGAGIGGADLDNRKLEPASCGTEAFRQAEHEYGEGYDFIAMKNGVPVIYDSTDKEPRHPAIRWGFVYVTITPVALDVTAYNYLGEVLDQFVIP